MLGGLGLKMRVVFDRWLGWGSLILLATSLSIFLVYYGNLCLSHRWAPGAVTTQPQVSDEVGSDSNLAGKATHESRALALSVIPTPAVPDKATKQPQAETDTDHPSFTIEQQER